jgi:hypothetical protein
VTSLFQIERGTPYTRVADAVNVGLTFPGFMLATVAGEILGLKVLLVVRVGVDEISKSNCGGEK